MHNLACSDLLQNAHLYMRVLCGEHSDAAAHGSKLHRDVRWTCMQSAGHVLHQTGRPEGTPRASPHSQQAQQGHAWAHVPSADTLQALRQQPSEAAESQLAASQPGSATSEIVVSPQERHITESDVQARAGPLVVISYDFNVSCKELHMCFGRTLRHKGASRPAVQAQVLDGPTFSFELQVLDAHWTAASRNTAARSAWSSAAVAGTCILLDTTQIFADSKKSSSQVIPKDCIVLCTTGPAASKSIHGTLRRLARIFTVWRALAQVCRHWCSFVMSQDMCDPNRSCFVVAVCQHLGSMAAHALCMQCWTGSNAGI